MSCMAEAPVGSEVCCDVGSGGLPGPSDGAATLAQHGGNQLPNPTARRHRRHRRRFPQWLGCLCSRHHPPVVTTCGSAWQSTSRGCAPSVSRCGVGCVAPCRVGCWLALLCCAAQAAQAVGRVGGGCTLSHPHPISWPPQPGSPGSSASGRAGGGLHRHGAALAHHQALTHPPSHSTTAHYSHWSH